MVRQNRTFDFGRDWPGTEWQVWANEMLKQTAGPRKRSAGCRPQQAVEKVRREGSNGMSRGMLKIGERRCSP